MFDDTTKFICSTNKKIADESLLSKIKTSDFDKVLEEVNLLLTDQKEKLKKLKNTNKDAGSSIKQTIKLIEFVLSKEDIFRIVKENLVIKSILYYRMNSTEPGTAMPELARSMIHTEGGELIKDWIKHL